MEIRVSKLRFHIQTNQGLNFSNLRNTWIKFMQSFEQK